TALALLVSAALFLSFFFSHRTAPSEIYTLSLHDALPICPLPGRGDVPHCGERRVPPPPKPYGWGESLGLRGRGADGRGACGGDRSEERRVGKEGRCRRGPRQKKKRGTTAKQQVPKHISPE